MKNLLMAAIAVSMLSSTAVATENVVVINNDVTTVQSRNPIDRFVALVDGYINKINTVKTFDELQEVAEECGEEMEAFMNKHAYEIMAFDDSLTEEQSEKYSAKLDRAFEALDAAVAKKTEELISNYDEPEEFEEVTFVEQEAEEEEIFDVVEEQPQFPGGAAAMMKFLSNNIQYPRFSRDNGSQGRAMVRFTVNSDGSIQDTEIIKSTGDMYLDREALRLVEIMPKWSPGRQAGKPVRVKFVLPVNFRLQDVVTPSSKK